MPINYGCLNRLASSAHSAYFPHAQACVRTLAAHPPFRLLGFWTLGIPKPRFVPGRMFRTFEQTQPMAFCTPSEQPWVPRADTNYDHGGGLGTFYPSFSRF